MTGSAWITADAVFDGQRLRTGMAVEMLPGQGARLAPLSTLPASVTPHHAGALISPGFLDLQVNGGGDVLLNGTPTPAGIRAIAAAHRALGTGGILPTLITDHPDVLDATVGAMLEVWGAPSILGLHIEGPHIAIARRGTHDTRFIRPLDDRTFAAVERLRAHGIPVLLTLAPEAVAAGQVARLAGMGVTVSIGHSDASIEEVRAVEAEGVTLFTHLFNAMSPMLNRTPGVTGAAIRSEAYCSFICDGIHAAPEMLRIAIAARPVADRMILVSDAMPTVGGGDAFELYGQRIAVRDGRLVNAEGSLAGAHITMAASVRNAIDMLDVAPEDALRMAITNPATLMDCLPAFSVGPELAVPLFAFDGAWQPRELRLEDLPVPA